MRFSLLILSALGTLLSFSQAWEPVIDPWDSHGRSKQGEKMALVRYTDGNCTTQMEQNHFKIAGLRGYNCHSFEWPFNSIAFEYPRVPRTGWQLIRGCKIRLYRGPSCEDELPRREFPVPLALRSMRVVLT